MNETWIQAADKLHRGRLQSLLGMDEIIEDVVKMLEDNKAIDNTYSELHH